MQKLYNFFLNKLDFQGIISKQNRGVQVVEYVIVLSYYFKTSKSGERVQFKFLTTLPKNNWSATLILSKYTLLTLIGSTVLTDVHYVDGDNFLWTLEWTPDETTSELIHNSPSINTFFGGSFSIRKFLLLCEQHKFPEL